MDDTRDGDILWSSNMSSGGPDEENEGCEDLTGACLPPASTETMELMEQIMIQKRGDPSKFASYWEMDEEDVDLATEDEIEHDPVTRTLWAAEYDHLDVLMKMLAGDVGLIQARDNDGYTPLHRACYNGHTHIVEYLLGKGAEIGARTQEGWSPLHSASNWGQFEVAAILLRHGADINARTNGKHTPLHLAAANSDSREMLETLLLNPLTDTAATNVQGETARDIAERNSQYHFLFDAIGPAVDQLCAN